MPVSPDYLEYIKEQLAWLPALSHRRMFGGIGLYADGWFFAILVDDTLYLKADDAHRATYSSAGAEPFRYQRDGKTAQMDYWSPPAEVLEEPDALRAWVELALGAARRQKR